MTGVDELFACPKCGSTRIIKAGFRWSQNEWKASLWLNALDQSGLGETLFAWARML